MNDINELKPCPWCGGIPTITLLFHLAYYDSGYRIKCLNKKCLFKPYTYRRYKKSVIKIWNRRKD